MESSKSHTRKASSNGNSQCYQAYLEHFFPLCSEDLFHSSPLNPISTVLHHKFKIRTPGSMCDKGEGREKPQLLSFFQQSQKGVVVIIFFFKKKLQGNGKGGEMFALNFPTSTMIHTYVYM